MNIYLWVFHVKITLLVLNQLALFHASLKKNYIFSNNAGYMKRFFDLFVALLLSIFLLIPILMIAFAIRLTSEGPVLYWSERIGKENELFKMPKFRTMILGTPAVATHLMNDPDEYLSPIGGFLRKTSMDEIPQLFSILKGEMSFVGPRPALYNQDDLVNLRNEYGVNKLIPGLTGWAQINGRDELPIPEKVKMDVLYMEKKSFWFDLKILWMTLLKVVQKTGVSH